MCNLDIIDLETEIDSYQKKLEDLIELNKLRTDLNPRDKKFADSLTAQYLQTKGLSPKQWEWVNTLANRVRKAEPIYGDFNALHVMFQLAGEHLKFPKVRLLTSKNTFVQLNFKAKTKDIDIYRDGWQGHGYRKFVGWIRNNQLVPYREDRLTDDIRTVIQELALDPIGTAKAMAGKLGSCMYCLQRLSNHESKSRGYGPVCAQHYGLPWDIKKASKKVKLDPKASIQAAQSI